MVRHSFRRSLAFVVLLCISSLSAAALAACGSKAPPVRPPGAALQPSATPAVASAIRIGAAAATAPATATSAAAPSPSATPPPTVAVATSSPLRASTRGATAATAAAVPELPPVEQLDAIALGGDTPVRSAPSMLDGETVATLADHQPIVIQRELRGQRWVVGDQTWAMAIQDWSNLWYQIDGGYVYAGFVYIPRAGELDSLADTSAERWVDIDLTTQTARAMIGSRVVHTAPITSGKPGFETPPGQHTIEPWGRKFNETMTSTQAGIKDPQDQYDVHNVLYTQYFDSEDDALHLNYWQPAGVFGSERTSHGCVGLQLHDAEYFWLFAQPGTRVVIRPLPATATLVPAHNGTPIPTPAPMHATAPIPTPAPTQTGSAVSHAPVLVPPLTPTATP